MLPSTMNYHGMTQGEVEIDRCAIADITHMFHNVPEIYIARETFLSMVICGPFSFRIPSLGLRSNKDMSLVVARYWTPWQRKMLSNIRKFGICPYYFEYTQDCDGNGGHPIPIIPEMTSGIMTVMTTKKHHLKYKWYWNDGMQQLEHKSMLWVLSDYPPDRNGNIRSALASLLPQYRLLRVIEQSLSIAVTQNANPTHVVEYHPAGGTARNDDLTTLNANFGTKVAGAVRQREESSRQSQITVRTKEFLEQTRIVNNINMYNGMATQPKLLWTDAPEDQLSRFNSGFDRVIPFNPDFKYVQAARATVVTEYEKHRAAFAVAAAACNDYSLEFIQPHGSARTQNIQGSERFENERIKEALQFLTTATQTALVIAYRKQFMEGFEQAKQWRMMRGGIAIDVAQLCPEMDVEVDMKCTPHGEYDQFKEMWMDGIISKETFAHHALHMKSMPEDDMHITAWPDQYPKELLVKPATGTNAKKPGGTKKKKKKPTKKPTKKRARVSASAKGKEEEEEDDDDEMEEVEEVDDSDNRDKYLESSDHNQKRIKQS